MKNNKKGMLSGMRCRCIVFRHSLPDSAIILEHIQTSYKRVLQLAKILLSITKYYKQIKPAANIAHDRHSVLYNFPTKQPHFGR